MSLVQSARPTHRSKTVTLVVSDGRAIKSNKYRAVTHMEFDSEYEASIVFDILDKAYFEVFHKEGWDKGIMITPILGKYVKKDKQE